jgi:hypothetical protein
VLRKPGKRDIQILSEDSQDLRLPTAGEKLRTTVKGTGGDVLNWVSYITGGIYLHVHRLTAI